MDKKKVFLETIESLQKLKNLNIPQDVVNSIYRCLEFHYEDKTTNHYGTSWIEYFCEEIDFGRESNLVRTTDFTGK